MWLALVLLELHNCELLGRVIKKVETDSSDTARKMFSLCDIQGNPVTYKIHVDGKVSGPKVFYEINIRPVSIFS